MRASGILWDLRWSPVQMAYPRLLSNAAMHQSCRACRCHVALALRSLSSGGPARGRAKAWPSAVRRALSNVEEPSAGKVAENAHVRASSGSKFFQFLMAMQIPGRFRGPIVRAPQCFQRRSPGTAAQRVERVVHGPVRGPSCGTHASRGGARTSEPPIDPDSPRSYRELGSHEAARKPRSSPVTVSSEDIDQCIRVLEALAEDRSGLAVVELERRTRFLIAAGRVSRPERTEQKILARTLIKQRKRELKRADEAILANTEIRKLRTQPVFATPRPPELNGPAIDASGSSGREAPLERLQRERVCYVCKQPYHQVHHFYDQICPPCGDFNYAKRQPHADLSGRIAYISGARVKIGYQAAILLLRAGARVIITTRFPRDAAERYAREVDFEDWSERLKIYGLDLRHTPSVESFARHLRETESRLDFMIHNACQTVRRPTGFYGHLMENEQLPVAVLPQAVRALLAGASDRVSGEAASSALGKPLAVDGRVVPGVADAPLLSQVKLTDEDHASCSQLFPEQKLDADLQQVDLRRVNSWRLALDQVGTTELLEVQLVNSIAPFVLNARLKPLMLRTRTFDQHIVNVSAVEGQFYRSFKTDKHPHTNMAKAALNMMTRTSAADYVRDGIHMNSVDTGWVTDEDPILEAERKARENGFSPPLDIVDGAARIVDPIFAGLSSGEHVWGQFLKDYRPAPW